MKISKDPQKMTLQGNYDNWTLIKGAFIICGTIIFAILVRNEVPALGLIVGATLVILSWLFPVIIDRKSSVIIDKSSGTIALRSASVFGLFAKDKTRPLGDVTKLSTNYIGGVNNKSQVLFTFSFIDGSNMKLTAYRPQSLKKEPLIHLGGPLSKIKNQEQDIIAPQVAKFVGVRLETQTAGEPREIDPKNKNPTAGRKHYEPKSLWKTFLIMQPPLIGLALVFAHGTTADFVGFMVGGQFLLVTVAIGNHIIKKDPYLKSRKSGWLSFASVLSFVAVYALWSLFISPWIFKVWDKNSGIDSDATFVSYNLDKFVGQHQIRTTEVSSDSILYANIIYSGYKAQINSDDPATETRWLNAMKNGDGLRVRFLSQFPSVVFTSSQLGLGANDIIDLHDPQPLSCPAPAPGAIPLNCTIDTPHYQ